MEKPGIYKQCCVKIKGEAVAHYFTNLCMQLEDFRLVIG